MTENVSRTSKNEVGRWVVSRASREWIFTIERGQVVVTYCRGAPFLLPVSNMHVEPEAVTQFCDALRKAARAAKRSRKVA